jgi:hypothetical protein
MILRPRSLLPLAVAAALAAPMFAPSTADAGVRIRIGGGVSVSGRIHVGPRVDVRVRRPRVIRYRPARLRIGGAIYVGGGAYYGPRFASPPPEAPPSCDCDTSVGAYYPGVATTAPVYVEPELPRFGIGVAAGSIDNENDVAGSDVALLARLRLSRSGSLELEGELGKSELEDSQRIDRRIGGALIWNLAPRNRLVPYLVGAMGVTQVELADDWTTDQSYGEVGIGLTYKLSRNLQIGADIRAGSKTEVERETRGGSDTLPLSIAPPDDQAENYTRGRISAMLYF